MNAMFPTSFKVAYRLNEYLSIFCEYALIYKDAKVRKKSKWAAKVSKLRWYEYIVLTIVGTLAFFYKVNKVGVCVFDIDENQIKRTCKLGVIRLPWADVVAIHRLSRAYLVEKARGGMPLPYRCLTAEQATALDGLMRRKEATLEH
ncbi:MAG: YcxB family protein [Gammaproteobacteria bacterium]